MTLLALLILTALVALVWRAHRTGHRPIRLDVIRPGAPLVGVVESAVVDRDVQRTAAEIRAIRQHL